MFVITVGFVDLNCRRLMNELSIKENENIKRRKIGHKDLKFREGDFLPGDEGGIHKISLLGR